MKNLATPIGLCVIKRYFEMDQPKDLTIQLLLKDLEIKFEKHFLTKLVNRYGL